MSDAAGADAVRDNVRRSRAAARCGTAPGSYQLPSEAVAASRGANRSPGGGARAERRRGRLRCPRAGEVPASDDEGGSTNDLSSRRTGCGRCHAGEDESLEAEWRRERSHR